MKKNFEKSGMEMGEELSSMMSGMLKGVMKNKFFLFFSLASITITGGGIALFVYLLFYFLK